MMTMIAIPYDLKSARIVTTKNRFSIRTTLTGKLNMINHRLIDRSHRCLAAKKRDLKATNTLLRRNFCSKAYRRSKNNTLISLSRAVIRIQQWPAMESLIWRHLRIAPEYLVLKLAIVRMRILRQPEHFTDQIYRLNII